MKKYVGGTLMRHLLSKLFICSILCFWVLSFSLIQGTAIFICDIETTGSVEFPADLDFHISKSPTEHEFFFEAVANDEGWFAVMAKSTDTKKTDEVFHKTYVDLYNPEGILQRELVFNTSTTTRLWMSDKELFVFFYDFVLCNSLATGETKALSIPPGSVHESDVIGGIWKSEFQAGDWKYTSKPGFLGYKELSRSNGMQEQVLISLPGSRHTLWNTVLPTLMAFLAAALLWRLKNKKK